MVKNYDPGRVVVTLGAIIVGYMDGSFVKVARNEATFKTQVGAGGDVTRVRSRNKTGAVTITLQQSSPSNDYLSGLHAIGELTGFAGLDIRPLTVKDLNGTTLYHAAEAWVEKPADGEFADDGLGREWTIACAELKMHSGGSVL